MGTDETKAVVSRMVEAWQAGDLDSAVAAYAPDFVYHNPVLAERPGLPPGSAAMRGLMADARAAFPDLTYTVELTIAEGDAAAVLYSWRGTHSGQLGGRPPTGRPVTATGAIFCRVAGGQIVEQWDIDDRLDVVRQLRLMPEMGKPQP